MTEQTLDLRTFLRAVRRYKAVFIVAVLLGVTAGAAYTVVHPPLPTSKAMVLLPSSATRFIRSEVVVATSIPVLSGARRQVRPPMTLDYLTKHVKASSLTSNIVSIIATGETGAQAKSAANAVAENYIDYIGLNSSAFGKAQAERIRATQVTQGSLYGQMVFTGVLGLLAGMVIGALVAVSIHRNRRRLRHREELATAVRAPVLASIAVAHPTDAVDWMRLLEDYEPSSGDEVALLRILQRSGLDEVLSDQPDLDAAHTIMVISLGTDSPALALGPQLAAFAATRGIPTALVIGPQHDVKSTESLRTACESRANSLPRRSRPLELVISPDGDDYWMQDAVLVVVVCAVKRKAPRIAELPATATLLAVSAGAATGEQLARIAATSASSGNPIDGVIVTKPDRSDDTTGSSPRTRRSASRIQPTRVTG